MPKMIYIKGDFSKLKNPTVESVERKLSKDIKKSLIELLKNSDIITDDGNVKDMNISITITLN